MSPPACRIHSSAQTPTLAPSPEATATAEVDAAVTALPGCGGILTPDQVDTLGEALEQFRPFISADGSDLAGPQAQAAYRDADATNECRWGVPDSDGGFDVAAALIRPATRDEFVAALSTSDLYDELPVAFRRVHTAGRAGATMRRRVEVVR